MGVVSFFGVYNAIVIWWELHKEQSRMCPKCAYTRLVLSIGLTAASATLMGLEWLRAQHSDD